jgi:hypothetical protein
MLSIYFTYATMYKSKIHSNQDHAKKGTQTGTIPEIPKVEKIFNGAFIFSFAFFSDSHTKKNFFSQQFVSVIYLLILYTVLQRKAHMEFTEGQRPAGGDCSTIMQGTEVFINLSSDHLL